VQKYVARRARKFLEQKNRLCLPALELAYVFAGISHAPREIIINEMLPEVEAALVKLKEFEDKPKKYEDGNSSYWDDYALTKFLEGVCMRYIAYPVRLTAAPWADLVELTTLQGP
jgi:hypothetical protein